MAVEEIKVQPQEQSAEDPAYIEAMVNKAEGKETSGEEEPKLLAGKYKSEEELTKGILEALKAQHEGKDLEAIYKALESGLHNKKSSDDKDKPEVEDSASSEIDSATSNTFDFSEYEEELLATGGLSEESYEALAKKGFPKEVVDVYLAGQKAIAEQFKQEFYQVVGGEANYKAMTEWAQVNLTEAEIQAFNDTLKGDNPEIIKMATEALYFRYTKAKGNPPKGLIQGSSPSVSTQGDAYQSIAELTADMSDPKYEKDPAFRRRVQERLAKSNIL